MNSFDNLLYSLRILVIIGLISLAIEAQPSARTNQFAQLPNDVALVLIAQQDACPIKIERTTLFLDLESKTLRVAYRLRNASSKKLRRITLSKWHLGGGGGDLSPIDFASPVRPNKVFEIGEVDAAEVKRLGDDWRKELGLKEDGMVGVILVFIRRVEYEDGSYYEQEKAMGNLQEFLNRIELRDEIQKAQHDRQNQ